MHLAIYSRCIFTRRVLSMLQVTATHFDKSENLLLCICGTKRLWLYAPSDARHLYPVGGKDGSRAAAPPFQSHAELPPKMQDTFANMKHATPIEVCRLPLVPRVPAPICAAAHTPMPMITLTTRIHTHEWHGQVNLVAGDLLYLPACWWHCVEGSRERNMILNWCAPRGRRG